MSDSWVRDRMQAGDLPRPGATADEYVEAYVEYRLGKAGPTGGASLEAERTRLTKEQADEKELTNAQLRRDLIPASEVAHAIQTVFTNFRRRALALPNNLAQRLAATSSQIEVDELLGEAMAKVLAALSETDFDALLNGADRPIDGVGGDTPPPAEA
jgi:phage terminase Nu1 subunit (DNA packaging protein)